LLAMRVAVISSGGLLILLSYSHNFELGLLIIASLSFCATVCGVATQSLIQTSITSDVRGRVMSLWGSINIGGGAVGGLLFGVLTESMGYSFTLVTTGLLSILIAYVATRKMPEGIKS